MKIEAIVFDFDGVLAESVEIKSNAFAELYKEYGQEIVKKVVAYHLENGGVSRFEKFRYYQTILLRGTISTDQEQVLGERFSLLVEDMVVKCPWVAGAKDFLDYYYKQMDFHIASGTPDNELVRIIRGRKMSHFFVTVNGSNRKKGEIISEILKIYNYNPAKVFMVGDALSDYEGAMEAKVKFVGRVQNSQKSPFPSSAVQTENPFYYLRSLF